MTQAARPWGDEIKARVRATMAYKDITWPAVAAAFDVSVSTIQRKLTQDSRSGEALRRELARLCDVPEWFILDGFAPAFVPPSVQRTAQEMEELQKRDDEEGRQQHGA